MNSNDTVNTKPIDLDEIAKLLSESRELGAIIRQGLSEVREIINEAQTYIKNRNEK